MGDDGISVTVLRSGDWEVIYVDGEERYSNHLNRSWPREILEIVEGETVSSTRVIGDDEIVEHVDEEKITFSPEGDEIWEYPSQLPEELY